MSQTTHVPAVRIIGTRGQVSLGRQYAGRRVVIEEQSPGVWLVRTLTAAPEGAAWLNEPEAAARLERALRWAAANPPDDSNTDQLLRELGGGEG